jgi:mono/diheme cytochrome c family protein
MQGRTLLRLPTRGAALIGCLLAVSCGGGGGGYSGGGGGGGGGGGTPTATFSSIQVNVFTPTCATCHSGAAAPHGLRLDAANSYALLVGVPSDEQPSILRVKANDPNNSYLVQKIQGTAATGERMPAGLPALPQATIDAIRQWITNGAMNDTPGSNAPIRVTSLSPLPSSTQTTLPATITAAFDRELNATSVDTTTFTLERSGGDGVFGNGNDVAFVNAVSVSVPAANPQTAVMSLAGIASVDDTYRITLHGSGATKILDLAGNALDGEFAGTFPSGNATAGGDFVATFTVGGLQPTLQSIQDNVFTPICSGCHTGGGAILPSSMNLTSSAASRAALVSVASVETGVLRVAPGNASNSYLIQKLEGTQTSGARMPFGGPFLDAATIAVIRQWIDSGAP